MNSSGEYGFRSVLDFDVGAADRNLGEEVGGADQRIVNLLGLQPAHELACEVGGVVRLPLAWKLRRQLVGIGLGDQLHTERML